MTTTIENDILTRVGPGTPMGAFMREFWVPACMSSELAADGDPLRLMILGEKLVGFRDSAGRVGVFDHRCPHRCASLFFGRNEQGGIRCIYHGWKFDVDGACVEAPNLPPPLDKGGTIRAKTYPTLERAGLVYVYMGSRATPPPFPAIEATLGAEEETTIVCRQRECNWLQALEGDLDTSHFGFLHAGAIEADDIDPDSMDRFQVAERAPKYHTQETAWGSMYAAYRPAEPGMTYYRFAQFLMPFWTLYPNGSLTHNVAANAWTPMDDTHVMIFNVGWKYRVAPLSTFKSGEPIPGLERNARYLPNTTDWHGRWRSAVNADNDYLIDRDQQRSGASFTGISGVQNQDMAVTESMGDLVDRTMEHLTVSDRMIAVTRKRLLDAVRVFAETGELPAIVDHPEGSLAARGGDLLAPEGKGWLEVYDEGMRRAEGPVRTALPAE